MEQLNCSIYKYGKFKDLERTLLKQTLGFSKLDSLNDPFEASYNYIHFFSTLERADSFDNARIGKGPEWQHRKEVISKIDSKLKKIVVTCFTQQPTEPLMWAHYAENHTGVCYCFDSDTLIFEEKFKRKDVQYSNKVPELLYFENSTTDDHLECFLPNVVCTKSDAWAYEKEIRFFGNSSETSHSFKPSSLKAVILGCRVNKEQEEKAKQLIEKANKSNNTNIKLLFAIKDDGFYHMNIRKTKIKKHQISSVCCIPEEPLFPG